jgi:hypothetical protein
MDVLIDRYTEKHPGRPEEQFKCLCIAMKAACKQTQEEFGLQFFTDSIAPPAGGLK